MTGTQESNPTPYRDEEWLQEKYWGEELSCKEIGKLCGVNQTTISRWLRRHDIERRSFGNRRKDLKYKDEEWLREQYVKKERSGQDIADECDVSLDVVQRFMQKFDIEARDPGGYAKDAVFKDPDWLRKQYWERELSLGEVAEEAGVESDVTILREMEKHDIPRRDPEPGNSVELTSEVKAFLEGLLLGDGHLTVRKGGLSAQYEHSDSFKEYLTWLVDVLSEFGIEQSGSVRELPNGSFACKTASYREFKELHERWYVDGERQLPEDFEISPTRLKNWYIGDGRYDDGAWFRLDFQQKEDSSAVLSSIQSDLSEVGIETMVSGSKLSVCDDSHTAFFNYILSDRPGIPPGYQHKFPADE